MRTARIARLAIYLQTLGTLGTVRTLTEYTSRQSISLALPVGSEFIFQLHGCRDASSISISIWCARDVRLCWCRLVRVAPYCCRRRRRRCCCWFVMIFLFDCECFSCVLCICSSSAATQRKSLWLLVLTESCIVYYKCTACSVCGFQFFFC